MSAPYTVGDWIFAEGVGMAQVTQRDAVGHNDWMLTCKIPDHPGAALRVLAKNVEPGAPPRGFRLECVWTNPTPPVRHTADGAA